MADKNALLQAALARVAAKFDASPPPPAILEDDALASITYVERRFAHYADAPALAHRQPGKDYQTLTFAELWRRVTLLATAWRARDIVRPLDRVGVMGFASVDWVVADLAALHRCATSIPLRTGMSDDDLRFIIEQSALRCVVCSIANLPQILRVLPLCKSVQFVIQMDATTLSQDATKHHVLTLASLCEAGEGLPQAAAVLPGAASIPKDPLMSVIYTSGSTGRPKGAMFPESLYRKNLKNLFDVMPQVPQVSLAFLPLNHVAGRSNLYNTLLRGGLVCFVQKSDMSTLMDDARAARPTTLLLVPRIAEIIYETYRRTVMQRGSLTDAALCQQVMQQMRCSTLGDRLVMLLAGTAPTPPQIIDFLQECFEVPVFDAYGATENGIVTFDHHVVRAVVQDYKLVDVPELGYSRQDKPYPRGELRLKSDRVIPGYLGDAAASAKLRDADGYMISGDIVEERGPDELYVIDRRHNILKLSQGEFVSIAAVEGAFQSGSPLISQIYVHGEPTRSYLLAVIVPDRETILAEHGCMPDATRLQDILRTELERVARQAQLHAFEVPRAFVVSDTPFCKGNGLLTESEKPARPQLLARFGKELHDLQARLTQASQAAQEALHQARDLPIEQKVQRAALVCLGSENIALSQSFIHAGGDSLSAVRLCETLQMLCGTAPPVAMVLDGNTTLQGVADFLAAQQTHVPGRPRFDAVHDARGASVTAQQIEAADFFPECDGTRREAPSRIKNVLLTGASGFLGRSLLLQLAQHAGSQRGQVTCVVRGSDDAAAHSRLRDAFAAAGPAMRDAFAKAKAHVRVVAGDLLAPRLGLSAALFAALAEDTDLIVHNGALVNHALDYRELYEPNVLGTVEAMRLCWRGCAKSFAFLSTVGVLGGLQRGDERTPAKTMWPERRMTGAQAWGYATSKWAGEILSAKLAAAGVPVHVFRPSLILPHTQVATELNPTDFLTRLLFGMAATGLRPASFYAAEHGPYGGLAVDFVATSIARLSLDTTPGLRTYNMLPERDHGFSLDGLCAALQACGYRLQPVAPYGRFYRRFEAALRALPQTAQGRSPLPILGHWAEPQRAAASIEHRQFVQAVEARLGAQSWPDAGEAYMRRYVEGMMKRALLPQLQTSRRDQAG